MYGLVQPPPRPRINNKTSLDAFNPMSGTTGMSPTRRRVRRVTPNPLIFNTASTAGDECSLTHGLQGPLDRLQQLHTQILTVLKAYCAKQHTSHAYVVALREFYRRVVALDPVLSAQFGDCDPAEVVCASPQRAELNAKQVRRGSMTPVAANTTRPAPRRLLTPLRQPTSPSPSRARPVRKEGPTAQEVDELEKDWWSSEVAAMWYGPRPGNRLITMSAGDAAPAKRRQSAESWVSGVSVASGMSGMSDVTESSGEELITPRMVDVQPAGSNLKPGGGLDAVAERKSESLVVLGTSHERVDQSVHFRPHSGSSGFIKRSGGFAGLLSSRSLARAVKA